jgi:hypothetical protein
MTQGSIAAYSWGDAGASFDDIRVINASEDQGAPIITSVTASPDSLYDNEVTQLGVVASNPRGGPAALTYRWTATPSGGSFDDPTSTTPVFMPPEVATQTNIILTVVVTNGEASGTDHVTVTVSDADNIGGATLLQEDFSDGSLSGWTVIDEGTTSGPSAWSAASGALVQSSNIYGGSTSASLLPKPGSYLRYDAGAGWTDYRASFMLRSGDDDALGLMFRVADNDNYYRFSWDQQRGYRRLVKSVGGVVTRLAEDAVRYVQGQTYQLEILAQGDLIEVHVDGTLVFSLTDPDIDAGSIAPYTWGNTGSVFDEILVEGI